jgi:isopentenyl diphosphate isomerase/L-lactate dehydrogenase-like FMN-dependent dehydrogenase
MAYLGYDKKTVDAMTGGKREQQKRNRIKPTARQYKTEKENYEFEQRVKKSKEKIKKMEDYNKAVDKYKKEKKKKCDSGMCGTKSLTGSTYK